MAKILVSKTHGPLSRTELDDKELDKAPLTVVYFGTIKMVVSMTYVFFLTLFLVGCSSVHDTIYRPHLVPEGDFVMLGHEDFVPFIEGRPSRHQLERLEAKLQHSLDIPLTERGFVQAANRLDIAMGDETNYDAVWVRDSIWVYFSFLETNEKLKAKKLILAIWDYYSTPEQLSRFQTIIKQPTLALEGGMHVPHIRFDGNDKNLRDVFKDGRPEEWNHRQNDAHGLFLLGLITGIKNGIITKNDFHLNRKKSLDSFVPYFNAIEFWNYPDAGAWEEINKINTSSVAMVVKALENWQDQRSDVAWDPLLVQRLIEKGYERIRKNLSLGGESPDHDPLSPEYRREDAALFNLFLPMPLKKLTKQEKLLGLTIIEKLIRPYGVIRYPLDSYQSGNYWVKADKKEGIPDLTGDSSSQNSFKARFTQFIPSSEAQWFFDSKLSMIYLQFAKDDKKYMRSAFLHFKRALGQITPNGKIVLGADEKPVMQLAFPESINTLVIDGKYVYAPSPITPLNWAKASFRMALQRLKTSLPVTD